MRTTVKCVHMTVMVPERCNNNIHLGCGLLERLKESCMMRNPLVIHDTNRTGSNVNHTVCF